MCGRYFFGDRTADEVEKELGLRPGSISPRPGDATPGMILPGIVRNRNGAQNHDNEPQTTDVRDLFWGLTSRDNKLIINARAESVLDKPMFSDSFSNRRCLLPAAGFYEWDKAKTKFIFKRPDGKPMYLAGLYDLNEGKDSFVILTTSPNSSMEPVHDRMPVMIEAANAQDYLQDTSAAMDLLKEPMPLLDRSTDYEQLSLF